MKWLGIIVFAVLVSLVAGWLALSTNGGSKTFQGDQLRLELLNNTSAATTIDDICCARFTGSRTLLPGNVLQTSQGGGPIWLKILSLRSPGVIEFSAHVDKVSLYRVSPNGTISTSVSGDTVSIGDRELVASTIAFEISQLDTQGFLFLEILMPTKIAISLDFYDVEEFAIKLRRMGLFHAALIGGILVIVLYNFLVSSLVRDPAYFYHASTILSLLILDIYLTGIGPAYIWSSYPWISNYVLDVSLGCTVVFGSVFAQNFLGNLDPVRNRKWPPPLLFFPPAALISMVALTVLPYWMVQAALVVLAIR